MMCIYCWLSEFSDKDDKLVCSIKRKEFNTVSSCSCPAYIEENEDYNEG